MSDELLCRINIAQKPLKELVGNPLLHRGGVLLHVLQTSACLEDININITNWLYVYMFHRESF